MHEAWTLQQPLIRHTLVHNRQLLPSACSTHAARLPALAPPPPPPPPPLPQANLERLLIFQLTLEEQLLIFWGHTCSLGKVGSWRAEATGGAQGAQLPQLTRPLQTR